MSQQDTTTEILRNVGKGTLIKTDDLTFYRIVGDYRDVDTPLNFDLVNVENSNDDMMLTSKQLATNLKNETWQKVNF